MASLITKYGINCFYTLYILLPHTSASHCLAGPIHGAKIVSQTVARLVLDFIFWKLLFFYLLKQCPSEASEARLVVAKMLEKRLWYL